MSVDRYNAEIPWNSEDIATIEGWVKRNYNIKGITATYANPPYFVDVYPDTGQGIIICFQENPGYVLGERRISSKEDFIRAIMEFEMINHD